MNARFPVVYRQPEWQTGLAIESGRFSTNSPVLVYYRCMPRTNIDIDDELCQRVMDRFHLATKREAVNLALERLAGEPLDVDEARSLRGSGWDGDLDEMRASRA